MSVDDLAVEFNEMVSICDDLDKENIINKIIMNLKTNPQSFTFSIHCSYYDKLKVIIKNNLSNYLNSYTVNYYNSELYEYVNVTFTQHSY
jgi:hypothetical protein